MAKSFYNLHITIVSDDLDKPSQRYETRVSPKISETTSPLYVLPIWNEMTAHAIKNKTGIMACIECDCIDVQKNYTHIIQGNLYVRAGTDSAAIEIQRDLHITLIETISGNDNTRYENIKDCIVGQNNNSIEKTLLDILTAIENLDLSTIT